MTWLVVLVLLLMMKKNLQSVVWREGKQYVSQCLNVDVSSFGNTKKSALDNLREALELYFDDTPKRMKITDILSPELVTI